MCVVCVATNERINYKFATKVCALRNGVGTWWMFPLKENDMYTKKVMSPMVMKKIEENKCI